MYKFNKYVPSQAHLRHMHFDFTCSAGGHIHSRNESRRGTRDIDLAAALAASRIKL